MKSGIVNLSIRDSDQKRIREEFSDKRIWYGFNHITWQFEVWYKPNNSRPYLICSAKDVCHAIYKLRQRLQNDRKGAKILLAEIDSHNDKLLDNKQADAMHEVRHDLRGVASGRRIFSSSLAVNRQRIKASYAV